MNRFWKVWLVLVLIALMGNLSLAVYSTVTIDISVSDSYHAYTKAFDCRRDYYIECMGAQLVNITPVGEPIMMPSNYTEWC